MSDPMYDRRRWQTLRAPILAAAKDTAIGPPLPASKFTAAVRLKCVGVSPAMAIIIRGFGTDADAEAVSPINVYGIMDPNSESGRGMGPAQLLWSGGATLGNTPFAAAEKVIDGDGKWTAGTWLEVDTWADVDDQVGVTYLNSTNKQGAVIIPTVGYTNLFVEIVGTTFTMASFGMIWRPITMSAVTALTMVKS